MSLWFWSLLWCPSMVNAGVGHRKRRWVFVSEIVCWRSCIRVMDAILNDIGISSSRLSAYAGTLKVCCLHGHDYIQNVRFHIPSSDFGSPKSQHHKKSKRCKSAFMLQVLPLLIGFGEQNQINKHVAICNKTIEWSNKYSPIILQWLRNRRISGNAEWFSNLQS